MRISVWLALFAALVTLAAILVIGQLIVRPPQPLIVEAGFAPVAITPNADGSDDVTIFSYTLSRNASITVTFEGENGNRFVYRENQPRTEGDYSVLFSGVVDGYVREGEQIAGEVLRRLMPNGVYTWRMLAVADADGETMESTGALTISDGDPMLPEMPEFTVFPDVFTPNQDGISDRTAINVYVTKEADLSVYLEREGVEPIFVPQRLDDFAEGQGARMYTYDYEGGVDLDANPPPDGEYTVVALAQDAVGQRVQRTATLTIVNGGKPRAQIVPQPTGATVVFEFRPYEERFFSTRDQLGDLIDPPSDPESLSMNTITMPVGDLLVFKLTVENYGEVPIRTQGSPPGTVYDWEQRAATFGEFDESGAWRVGIDCDTADADYPWRWMLGDTGSLTLEIDPNTGNTYYYLPPHSRSVVWGAVRMTTIEARNPQNCWAGLIHEDVEVTETNRFVGPRQIELVDPTGGQTPADNG
jgi:hypothetical protein